MTGRPTESDRFSIRRLPLLLLVGAQLLLFGVGCSRSRPQAQAATVPQLPPIEFVAQWGVKGDAPGELDQPVGPAIDAVGRVYLADRGTSFLQKFETDGVPLLSFENTFIRGADAVAVDSGGGIYIVNLRGGAVEVFFPEGDLLRGFHVAPQRNYEGPFALSVDALGNIYMPDPAGGRVQVLSPTGRLERVWKVPPAAAGAAPARPIAAIAGTDGFVYVADAQAGRIVKFTDQGQQATAWDDAGANESLLGIAVFRKYVFALHASSPRLTAWSSDGQKVLDDDLGGRLGAPPACCTLTIGSAGDLIVLDSGVPRVLHFRVHLGSP